MNTSFSELKKFWDNNYFTPNFIVLKSKKTEDRSNLFMDLIINQSEHGKVYICCASKYMLEGKLLSLNLKNMHNINFIEHDKDISLYYSGVFFFYEPSYLWMPKIQALVYNHKQVVVDHSDQENFSYARYLNYQEIDVSQDRGVYSFKINQSGISTAWNFTSEKPLKLVEFSYFLESNNLKMMFEKFFDEKFSINQISIRNYFPDVIHVFTSKLKTLLAQHNIKSYKFYKLLKDKTIKVKDGVVEIDCIYINICLNIVSLHPNFKIDYLYKFLEADLNHAQMRRSHYNFFKLFKEDRLIKILTNSRVQEFCYLESIELDCEMIKNKNAELLNLIPRRVQKLNQFKDFLSQITYKYHENKKFPKNVFHYAQHPQIFVPKDFFQLYEIKLTFRNCVSIYFNEILENKKIIIKVTSDEKKYCVSLDCKNLFITSIKLADNKDPTPIEVENIEKIINQALDRKPLSWIEKVCQWIS